MVSRIPGFWQIASTKTCRAAQVAAGIQQVIDLGTVNLVEVAVVRNQRIAGLFGGLAYRGWIALCRQATHVDFIDPTFS